MHAPGSFREEDPSGFGGPFGACYPSSVGQEVVSAGFA